MLGQKQPAHRFQIRIFLTEHPIFCKKLFFLSFNVIDAIYFSLAASAISSSVRQNVHAHTAEPFF